ncbi:MAG: hypothetical protein LBG60_07260, partial [Bifidobacteriaceae bacterium]|nr:hypothetical protein [Bifidobacteriaceae bacterium]
DKAGLDTNQESLYVAEAYVDEGPTMKRFRPRAKGRADRILKRSSHITMVVRQAEEPAASASGRRGARSGGIGLLRRSGRGPAGGPAKTKASKKGRTR